MHSIGNLVLIYDNSAYSNFDYVRKRGDFHSPGSTYARSLLQSELEIAREHAEWTPESIRRRSEALGEWGLARWPIVRHPAGPAAKDALDDIDARADFEGSVRESEEGSADT